ncbi:MAG: class IV adenylate cyclase [Sciscionella sp.]
MAIEHEAKILDIDPDTIHSRITELGGTKIGTYSMRRYVYDIDPADQSRWIRLRDTGTMTTLAVKHITSDVIDGTHETEVMVSDFDTTNALLAQLGYTPKSYQENTRTTYQLDGAELDIDTWPRIPPYLEIEADTPQAIHDITARFGYTEADLTSQNTTKIYAHYGIDLTTITDLRFV